MYIHMNTMAKTIMVSNTVYEELKEKKEKQSFSELITRLLHANKEKTGSGLRSCYGLLAHDTEFITLEKSLKKDWKEWNKKYV